MFGALLVVVSITGTAHVEQSQQQSAVAASAEDLMQTAKCSPIMLISARKSLVLWEAFVLKSILFNVKPWLARMLVVWLLEVFV
jgi:type IV secretory pathway TrbD component